MLITYSSTHILSTCLCEIIFYYQWAQFIVCLIFSSQTIKTPAIQWGKWIKTGSGSLLVTDTVYPLAKPFIPGKARWKDYSHANGNKEAKCLVSTKKRFVEMGLEMKHFSHLATPLASLWLTYKVFCKVYPTKRTMIEDTRTVLGQTTGQSSLITCLLHYSIVTERAIPEQTQLCVSLS